jgi:20S proteasome subunit alpha 3
MEAISHAGTVLGVLAKDGVVLAAEKKVTGKLLDLTASKQGGYGGSGEKIFLLNSCVPNFSSICMTSHILIDVSNRNVIGGVAGLTADANSLVNYARTAAQQHLLTYNEDIPVELLAQRLCDMKQGYTQFGGNSIITPYVIPVLNAQIIPYSQVYDRSVYQSFMQAMTPITIFSSTTRIHQVTTLDGKRRASEPTMALRKAC